MFERFTASARNVVVLAVQEALALDSRQVRAGHLLLALSAETGPAGLVLQQAGGAFPQVGRDRSQAGRRHPVVGPASPGRDLLGPALRHRLLGGEDLALEVVEHDRPVHRRGSVPRGVAWTPLVHDGLPAIVAAAARHASRSGSTT